MGDLNNENEYSLIDELSNLNNGLEKIENPDIKQSNSHLKLKPKIFEISWQTYRFLGFVFFGLSFFVMKYIVDYFDDKLDDKDMLNVLKVVSFFFILNFGTFLFMNVYYKYRKSVKGIRGPKGNVGKRGNQGDSSYCNICDKKTGGFRKEYDNKLQKEKIVQNVLIDFDNNEHPSWLQVNHIIKILNKDYRLMTPTYMGPGKSKVKFENNNLNDQIKTSIYSSDKPIIGVSASINNITGELYSIMYLIDGNKHHNKKKYKYKPMHKNPLGVPKKYGYGIEFKAPPNSAINKVEVFHNGQKIISIRFYCLDIITGELVKVIDPTTNRKGNFATIGKKISKFDSSLVREVVEAGNFIYGKKMYPSFISEVSAVYNNLGINSLGFLKSSIYQDGFKLIFSEPQRSTQSILE